jgi:hypothetical protein
MDLDSLNAVSRSIYDDLDSQRMDLDSLSSVSRSIYDDLDSQRMDLDSLSSVSRSIYDDLDSQRMDLDSLNAVSRSIYDDLDSQRMDLDSQQAEQNFLDFKIDLFPYVQDQRLAIGIRQPIPKARSVTFNTGGAWRRLNSVLVIRLITRLTVSTS